MSISRPHPRTASATVIIGVALAGLLSAAPVPQLPNAVDLCPDLDMGEGQSSPHPKRRTAHNVEYYSDADMQVFSRPGTVTDWVFARYVWNVGETAVRSITWKMGSHWLTVFDLQPNDQALLCSKHEAINPRLADRTHAPTLTIDDSMVLTDVIISYLDEPNRKDEGERTQRDSSTGTQNSLPGRRDLLIGRATREVGEQPDVHVTVEQQGDGGGPLTTYIVKNLGSRTLEVLAFELASPDSVVGTVIVEPAQAERLDVLHEQPGRALGLRLIDPANDATVAEWLEERR